MAIRIPPPANFFACKSIPMDGEMMEEFVATARLRPPGYGATAFASFATIELGWLAEP
jgi:hypothetical protein